MTAHRSIHSPGSSRNTLTILAHFALGSVILLGAPGVTLGGSLLPNPSASPAQAPAAISEMAISEPGSGDGFQRTVTAFVSFEKKGGELSALLKKLHAEAAARYPGDSGQQQVQFLKSLGELYPGSADAGGGGIVKLPKGYVATFDKTLTVESIKETGEITATYRLAEGQIHLKYGSSSVIIAIDRVTPSRSRFDKAIIPAIRAEAERIVSVPGYTRTASDSVETAILNDVYQLLSLTNSSRMDYFAADVMKSATVQQKSLAAAGRGYFERHAGEYEKGAAPVKGQELKGEIVPPVRLDALVGVAGRILLVILLATGFYGGVRLLIKRAQYLFLDAMSKEYLKKYNSLSPLVVRSLRKLGRSLWGRNFLWSKKYYVEKRSERWLLSDGKRDRYSQNPLERNRLEVCLRDTNFRLRITRRDGEDVDLSLLCVDFSEKELLQKLEELRLLFKGEQPASGPTAS